MRVTLLTDLPPEEAPMQRAAREGLKRLHRELNAAITLRTTGSPDEGRRQMRAAAGAGADVVFCLGHDYETLLYEETVAYPSTWFIQVPGNAVGANIASINFATGEAGFVAGAAAAALSAKAAAGIIREGPADPFFARAEGGFKSGFQARRSRGRVIAVDGLEGIGRLASAHVDVALDTAEKVDRAVLQACRKAGIRLVVTDPDLTATAPDVVVGTLKIDLAEAMNRVVQEVWAGTVEGKLYRFDLGSGVVGFELNPKNDAAAGAGVADVVERARADVTAGIVEIEELGW